MFINSPMIRLLIADDHAIVREGIKRVIEKYPDIQLVAEAASGDEVLSQIKNIAIDILLLDISMPGPGFLNIMQNLQKDYPAIKVLVLSVHPEDHYALRALKAGAKGYIDKSHSMEELHTAIRQINEGHRYITPRLAEKMLLEHDANIDRQLHDKLSEREFQILLLIGEGKTVTEIASILSLSPKTVSTYRARILEKMKFRSNNELIRYTIENELIN